MTSVSLIDLCKAFAPGVPAVSHIQLDIKQGEMLVLLGPSGSGKTTILRLVAGLLRPTSGDLLYDGRSVLDVPPEKRQAVMVFQNHLLFPFMSVGDNIAFGLKMRGLSRGAIQQRVEEALAAVQLDGLADRWPDQLSGGQTQRAALARALVVEPRLLLLDEPLSNLEPGLRQELRQMIRAIQQERQITTLFVTHDQDEAVEIADRIALLINGQLRQVGPPRDFYERPADKQVVQFFGGVNFLSGFKRGLMVKTEIGTLEVGHSTLPDGPVLVNIRPEAIAVGANGCNNFLARVHSSSYRGLSAWYRMDVNGVELQMAAAPFDRYRAGEPITLHLPSERICLLPVLEKD